MIQILQIVGLLLGIGSLICWILEIVAAFKNEEAPTMGILSIVPCFGLGGFVIGWINAKKWGITKLMTIWTVLFVVQILVIAGQMVLVGKEVSAGLQGLPLGN